MSAIDIRPGGRLPILLSVPHSGRDYGDELVEQARLGRRSLERLEDPLVDLLVAGAIATGAGAVIARAPRALIDCNRAESELDPRAIRGRAGAAPTARARAGLGLIPTRLGELGDLWRAPIDEQELLARLDGVHRAYHSAIAAEIASMRRQWDQVLLLDCHSMPPRARGEPNLVVGDRHGESAAGWLSDAAVRVAQALGFEAQRNIPFAGGHVVERHGAPQQGVHALQIEVDRACYAERDLRTLGPGFGRVRTLFERLARDLGQMLSPCREAAE